MITEFTGLYDTLIITHTNPRKTPDASDTAAYQIPTDDSPAPYNYIADKMPYCGLFLSGAPARAHKSSAVTAAAFS